MKSEKPSRLRARKWRAGCTKINRGEETRDEDGGRLMEAEVSPRFLKSGEFFRGSRNSSNTWLRFTGRRTKESRGERNRELVFGTLLKELHIRIHRQRETFLAELCPTEDFRRNAARSTRRNACASLYNFKRFWVTRFRASPQQRYQFTKIAVRVTSRVSSMYTGLHWAQI